VHNTAPAIAVAALVAPALTVPAAVYSTFMPLTAAAFARLLYRRNIAEAAITASATRAPGWPVIAALVLRRPSDHA